MTLKTKKKIAREFIFFISCLLISLFSYCIWVAYYNYQEKKIAKITNTITEKKRVYDSLSKPYFKKIHSDSVAFEYTKGIFKNLEYAYGLNGVVQKNAFLRTFEEFIIKLQDTSYLRNIYDNLTYAFGQNNMPDYELFKVKTDLRNKSRITEEDSKNYKAATQINLDVEVKRKEKTIGIIQSKTTGYQIIKSSLVISLLVLFVLRFFIFSIIWSFKVLRQS